MAYDRSDKYTIADVPELDGWYSVSTACLKVGISRQAMHDRLFETGRYNPKTDLRRIDATIVLIRKKVIDAEVAEKAQRE